MGNVDFAPSLQEFQATHTAGTGIGRVHRDRPRL
jgi:hypothetical protein